MKHYKNQNNKPFSYDEDISNEMLNNLISVNNLTLITDDEFNELLQPSLEDYKIQKQQELEEFYNSDEIRLEKHYGATLPNRSWFKAELNKEIVAETSDFLWYLDDGSELNVNSEQIKVVFKELVKNMKLLFYIKRHLLIDLDLLTTKEKVNQWLEAGKKALLKEKSKQKSLV